MSEGTVIPDPAEVVESITPSPLVKYVLIGLVGVAGGIALGYMVAKILEEDRVGHYEPSLEVKGDEVETVVDEPEDEHPSLFETTADAPVVGSADTPVVE